MDTFIKGDKQACIYTVRQDFYKVKIILKYETGYQETSVKEDFKNERVALAHIYSQYKNRLLEEGYMQTVS